MAINRTVVVAKMFSLTVLKCRKSVLDEVEGPGQSLGGPAAWNDMASQKVRKWGVSQTTTTTKFKSGHGPARRVVPTEAFAGDRGKLAAKACL